MCRFYAVSDDNGGEAVTPDQYKRAAANLAAILSELLDGPIELSGLDELQGILNDPGDLIPVTHPDPKIIGFSDCVNHPDCTLKFGHPGDCKREEPAVTYTLPGPPVTGRRVTTATADDPFMGKVFRKEPDGTFMCIHGGPHEVWSWAGLLGFFGTLTLIPLTEREKAHEKLYGPLGARWGDPEEPCPYRGCQLGIGHIQAHIDRSGDPLGQTTATETDPLGELAPWSASGISPHEASEVPCNCGHPERHTPECPRGQRIYGAVEWSDVAAGELDEKPF